ncbi:MAG: SURF1 family protein [Actinomycetota bacterium]
MLRFLLRPRWIGLSVFAIVAVVACVMLGLWQLDRLEERRELNDRFAAGLATAPAPLQDLLADASALEYRRAIATGRYDTEHEVILYGRTLNGQAGNHVLTPLVLADGRAVIVDRGWVPFEMDEPPVSAATPPSGEVEVEGALLAGRAGGAGEIQPGAERVTTVRTVDIEAIARDVPYELVPWFLQLRTQSPAAGSLPVPEPAPELTEGPHLGYAFQWFAFAVIAAVGYVILVRREVKEQRALARV